MKRKTFPHGTHPPSFKELTAEKPIEFMPAPDKVYIPLLQHFTSPAVPLVKKGDAVFLGQKIGDSAALFSAPVHSSVSGRVLAVDQFDHPSGRPHLAVTVANDGQDRIPPEKEKIRDPMFLTPDEIRQIVRDAGIVGLGGAAFPTAVKLSPPKDKPIDTLLINGCECEPWLTSDYRLMLEHPEEIIRGADLARRALGAQRIIIGIEDNKPKALEAFQAHILHFPVEVALLKTKYPQGAEKNLIFALLRRKVPRGGLPFDVGVVVLNVATAKAIWDAAGERKSLYQRAITVSGIGVEEPKNILVRVGTLLQKVTDFCGGLKAGADLLILGGPMMGMALSTLEIPVIKGTTGVLVWTSAPLGLEYNCISCGRCVTHCPMSLVPTRLMKYIKFEKFAEAEAWGILDCVECGCCQYSCPAKIPLVHWIRVGKNKIVSLKRKKSA